MEKQTEGRTDSLIPITVFACRKKWIALHGYILLFLKRSIKHFYNLLCMEVTWGKLNKSKK